MGVEKCVRCNGLGVLKDHQKAFVKCEICSGRGLLFDGKSIETVSEEPKQTSIIEVFKDLDNLAKKYDVRIEVSFNVMSNFRVSVSGKGFKRIQKTYPYECLDKLNISIIILDIKEMADKITED